MDETYKLNPFERATALILSATWFLLGLYYAGPWYVETSPATTTGASPALYLFPEVWVVNTYGVALALSSLVVGYAAIKNNCIRLFSSVLLVAWLLRTYHLIGTLLSYDSLLPPSYMGTVTVVMFAAALWLWVRYDARTA